MTSVASSEVPSDAGPMRKRGTGTIEMTRDGRHRMRLYDDRGVRIPLGVVDSREEAELLLEAACDDLARARARVHSGVTLKEYGKRWLARRKAAGMTNEGSRWATHVAPDRLAELPVRAIEAHDIRVWIDRVSRSRASKGNKHAKAPARILARQTVVNVLNMLRSCLQGAVDDRIIPANPATGVTVPKRREDKARATVEDWTWLDLDEQQLLISACPEPQRWIVQWAIWTGMRESEIWELRSADVRADSPRPHVVVRYGSEGKGATKTRRIRYVPLLPGAIEAWERWCEAAAERIEATGVAFPPLRGSRRATRAPGPPPWWERAVQESGVRGQTGAPVRFHSLRHTCASMLVSGSWGAAWSLEEVRGFLGHSDIASTQRYAHLAQSALERAADRTRVAMGQPAATVVTIPSARREPAAK
jgi:integrase